MSGHTSCIAREYSEKSDMWSLGMVLYAMCFTSLPFSHDDPHAPWVRKSWVHMSNVGETFYCRAPSGNSWNPIYEFISDSQEWIIDFMNSHIFITGCFLYVLYFVSASATPKGIKRQVLKGLIKSFVEEKRSTCVETATPAEEVTMMVGDGGVACLHLGTLMKISMFNPQKMFQHGSTPKMEVWIRLIRWFSMIFLFQLGDVCYGSMWIFRGV